MKLILCFTLCVLLVSAKVQLGNLSNGLDLLALIGRPGLQGVYNLTSSFTFANNGTTSSLKQLIVKGHYNLLSTVNGTTNTTTGSFENTTSFSVDHARMNISGTGTFSATGNASAQTGSFHGGYIADFVIPESPNQSGVKTNVFSANISGKKYSGAGNAELHAWKGPNITTTLTDYRFNGQTNADFREFSGKVTSITDETGFNSTLTRNVADASFKGTLEGSLYYMLGSYKYQVLNASGSVIYNSTGNIVRNGTDSFIPDLTFASL